MLNNLQKNLELVNEFNKSIGCKLITRKSVVFFYTSIENYTKIQSAGLFVYIGLLRENYKAEEGNQR